jgi:hypothetical protein
MTRRLGEIGAFYHLEHPDTNQGLEKRNEAELSILHVGMER